MRFYDAADLNDVHLRLLAEYDSYVKKLVGPSYRWPIRLRDWELSQTLVSLGNVGRVPRILDTGSVNTFFGLWLARLGDEVIVSDLLGERIYKNVLRRVGIWPRKRHEANVESWFRVMRRQASISIKSVDLCAMRYPDESFDLITSISVVEHIPNVEKALAEMYRCLRPGGRLIVTTDCSPAGRPYRNGVRYFSPDELKELFAGYPVATPYREPDFREENWCYHKTEPLVTAYLEIVK